MNIKTDLVSPQFHVVFYDELTTVPYLFSSKSVPPNWISLDEHSTERVNDEEEKLATPRSHPGIEDTYQHVATPPNASTGIPHNDIIPDPGDTLPLPSSTETSPLDDNHTSEIMGKRDNKDNNFINLDILGRIYSGIKRKPSDALKESDPKSKGTEGYRKRCGILVIELSAFAQTCQFSMHARIKQILHYYQVRSV